MHIITVNNFHFQYSAPAGEEAFALQDITFSIEAGEFVVLCGPSGCGKSTLLRHLKPVFAPNGSRSGEIQFDGMEISGLDFRRQSAEIGFVGQSPDNQIVTDKVWHELAFGLESLGADPQMIRGRVAETAAFFGMETWFDRSVNTLSGGQRQLLNLASVMGMEPRILLLDEPTAQLDPIAAGEFLGMVARINRELGVTVLLCEHRLEEALAYSDRLLVLDQGRLAADGSPDAVGLQLREQAPELFLSMPVSMRIWAAVTGNLQTEPKIVAQAVWPQDKKENLENTARCPWTVSAGRTWLEGYGRNHSLLPLPPEQIPENSGICALSMENIWFRYEKDGADVLRGASCLVNYGEILAILGGNGTGKSTLLSLVTGANQPDRGRIVIDGKPIKKAGNLFDGLLGVLPQNPKTLFTRKTVREDLLEILEEKQIEKAEQEAQVQRVLQFCQLEHKAGSHPYDLSGGEQQRAALAKVLLLKPKILLLDEPTKGMDQAFQIRFGTLLRKLQRQGVAIVLVSHDVEFCAAYAHRCVMLFHGSMVSEQTPRQFFSANRFYTTAASRMAKTMIPGAVTAEDVIAACGGSTQPQDTEPDRSDHGKKTEEKKVQTAEADRRDMHTKNDPGRKNEQAAAAKKTHWPAKTVCALLMVLLAIPVTIYIGVSYLGDQKYLFISLLVLLEAMLPFFLVFEGRKPKARELVLLAVLCALGIAGRGVFYMVPQIKPVTALTVLAGVVFGKETGFLVGALTMFGSNLFFGQGPWTPWQMFAMGLIGFLAGLLYKTAKLRPGRISLSIYGFLAALLIYGGILNPASVVLARVPVNWVSLSVSYAAGLPMDLVHAVSTAVFLFFLAGPMLEKLERVKGKYGGN